jgi:hypothetical protein
MRQEINSSQTAQILIWFLFVVAVLSSLARLGTKYGMNAKFGFDDGFLLAALVFYLGQCISLSIAASEGFGKSFQTISVESLNIFLLGEYVGTAFFLLASAAIKWSISAFIQQLSPNDSHRRINLALAILIGLWLVSAIFPNFFQCALPSPWDYVHGARCIDRVRPYS